MSKKSKARQDEWVPGSEGVLDVQEEPKKDSEPSPELVLASEPAQSPPPVRPPRGEGVVPLAVFLRLTGRKPDQMVPFARWAAQKSPRPKSVADWKVEFDAFMNRPVSG